MDTGNETRFAEQRLMDCSRKCRKGQFRLFFPLLMIGRDRYLSVIKPDEHYIPTQNQKHFRENLHTYNEACIITDVRVES